MIISTKKLIEKFSLPAVADRIDEKNKKFNRTWREILQSGTPFSRPTVCVFVSGSSNCY